VPIEITSENDFVAEGDRSSTTTKPALIQYLPTLQVHPSDLQIRYNEDYGKIRVKQFFFDEREPYYDDPYAWDEFNLTFLKPFWFIDHNQNDDDTSLYTRSSRN